ncbi:hypothetical protein QBC35DRAFT_538935 [Podospora australis]|uniref:Nephrocystin 3-like N-terminal domain-containing protein n=1 Tax=Podospora australis TaxID=1536484 RepID=A0AAN6WZ34_9PEZI|nr:hypothetical protein QBC35DRAFT_538935 [Podospora australis]
MTWSKNRDADLFSPRVFLPQERDINSARILTFGYNVDVKPGSRSNVKSVLDFAKDLLYDLKYSKDENTDELNIGSVPLAFVVHFMGGLVVKAFGAILFISTPHLKNSTTIQNVNEQFRHLAPRLRIVSFYETKPTAMGPAGPRIKDSSVLGYPGEVSKPLDADHHTVCKFDSTNDPNYITVRNYLKLRDPSGNSKPGTLFSITDPSDTDLIFFRDRWTPSTCEWILQKPEFVQWLDPIRGGPRLLWLHAPGGSGKSVLASFVVNHLVEIGLCCQYVFTRFSDQNKRSLSWILRSLAFQMAQVLPAFRALLGGLPQGLKLKGADPRAIWQRVFKDVLFRIVLSEPIYWVIDGLDEADNPRQAVKFFGDVLQTASPIRILVLSRPSSDIEAELKRMSARWEGANLEERAQDFHVFINRELEWDDIPKFKEKITQQLLDAVHGNFLWLRLTVDRINRCHTEEDVNRALQQLPPGMEDLFDRIAAGDAPSLKPSAVDWDPLWRLLVIGNGETVTMVHQAAREYLLNAKDRPFGIDQRGSHSKLLLRCLTFLSTPGVRARISHGEEPGLLSYAASYWAAHLQASNNVSQDIMTAVVKFLRGPSVLTWIQAVAQAGNLHFLVQASAYLPSFALNVSRVIGDQVPLDRNVAEKNLIKSWATDLSKIVGKFGNQLLGDPDSIYRAIPPFCPPNSAIYWQFSARNFRGITVNGWAMISWDDVIARLSLVSALRDNVTTVFIYRADTYQEARRIRPGERVRKFQVNRLGTLLVTCGYSTTRVWDMANGICLTEATNPRGRPRPQAVTFIREDTCVLISSEDRRLWLLRIAGHKSFFEEITQIMDRTVGGDLVNSPTCAALNPDGCLLAIGYRKSSLSVWEVGGSECLARCLELERVQETIWHPFSGEILGMHTGGVVLKWDMDGNELVKIPVGASTMAISPKGNLVATGDMRGNISLLSTSDLGLIYRAVCQDPVMGVAFSVDGLQLYDIRHSYGNVWEPKVLLKLSETTSQSDTASESDTLGPQVSLSETLYNKIDPVTALSPEPHSQLFCTGSEEEVVALNSADLNNALERGRSASFMGIEQLEWNDDGTLLCAADLSRTILVRRVKHTNTEREGWETEMVVDMSIGDFDGNIDQIIFQPKGNLLFVCSSQSAVIISMARKEVIVVQNIETPGGRWMNHPFSQEHLVFFAPSVADIYTWHALEKVTGLRLTLPFGEYTTQNTVHINPSFSGGFESHSDCKGSVDTPAEVSSALVRKRVLSPSQNYLLMQLSMEIDEQRRSAIRLLDTSPLKKYPTQEPDPLVQNMSRLNLDSKTFSITLMELPDELVDRIYQPLAFIAGRGAGSEMLLFLDCDSSIRSWRGSAVSVTGGYLSQTTVSHYCLPSDWVGPDYVRLFRMLSDGTLLCPRNGQVFVVKCKGLGG